MYIERTLIPKLYQIIKCYYSWNVDHIWTGGND